MFITENVYRFHYLILRKCFSDAFYGRLQNRKILILLKLIIYIFLKKIYAITIAKACNI